MWLGKGIGIFGFSGKKGGCRFLVGLGRGFCGLFL